MSFVDELRREPVVRYDDVNYLSCCRGAIMAACKARKAGGAERVVRGFIYSYNDDGYREYAISESLPAVPKPYYQKYMTEYSRDSIQRSRLYRDYDFKHLVSEDFERKLKKEVENLGFTNYRVVVGEVDDWKPVVTSSLRGWKVSHEKSGTKAKTIYVEVRW